MNSTYGAAKAPGPPKSKNRETIFLPVPVAGDYATSMLSLLPFGWS